MRDYAKVAPKFWIGETGKKLRKAGMEAQIVAMYLVTCPHANMLGLYYVTLGTIAHETGLGLEGASKGLQSSIEAGFCEYDEASEVVWVIEMAGYQIDKQLAPKDNRVKGVQNEYDAVLKNPYLARFFEKYQTAFHMENCRGLASPFEAPLKPLRSQEQEQEQEQEQNHELSESKETRQIVGTGQAAPLTLIGEICRGLKALGMGTMNQSNPDFLMLLDAGADAAEFLNTAAEIKAKSPEKLAFNYLVSTVKNRRIDAKNNSSRVFRGPLQTQQAQPKTASERRRQTAIAMFPSFHNQDRQNANVIDITPANTDRALISQDG